MEKYIDMQKIYLTLILGLITSVAYAQITASKDTACKGNTVNFTTTAAASQYVWSSQKIDVLPTSIIGYTSVDVKSIGTPYAVAMKNMGGNYVGFAIIDTNLYRLNYGADPFSAPTITNLGNFNGALSGFPRGIDVVEDNGLWYGFVTNQTKIVRLNFNNSLLSTPTANVMNFGMSSGFSFPAQITMVKYGSEWLCFIVDRFAFNEKLFRIDFGTSLSNTPTTIAQKMGNSLNGPAGFAITKENGNWYMVVANSSGGTGGQGFISGINFGTDLKASPIGDFTIGNPQVGSNPSNRMLSDPHGVVLVRSCDTTYIVVTNSRTFGNGGEKVCVVGFAGNTVTGTPTFTNLGNLGLAGTATRGICAFWHQDGTNNKLCMMAASNGDSTINIYDNIYSLPPSASISTTNNGYSAVMNTGGVNAVTLLANPGMPVTSVTCKEVYVLDNLLLGIKQFDTIMVAAGSKFDFYEWRKNGDVIPGATNDTLTGLEDGAVYTVIGTKSGCTNFSTVKYFRFPTGVGELNASTNITVFPNPSTGTVNIKASGVASSELKINCYNMMGALVSSTSAVATDGQVNTSINLSALPKGIYQLRLQTASGSYMHQVVLE